MAGNMKYAILLLAIGARVALAQGALPADPTRPPIDGVAPSAVSGVSDAGSGGPRLQSVMLPKKGGRPKVVIDGKLLSVGEEFQGRTVVRIDETRVVLDGPDGRETLYLTPDVEKTMNMSKAVQRRNKDQP